LSKSTFVEHQALHRSRHNRRFKFWPDPAPLQGYGSYGSLRILLRLLNTYYKYLMFDEVAADVFVEVEAGDCG
jgi:hypothetical protein